MEEISFYSTCKIDEIVRRNDLVYRLARRFFLKLPFRLGPPLRFFFENLPRSSGPLSKFMRRERPSQLAPVKRFTRVRANL